MDLLSFALGIIATLAILGVFYLLYKADDLLWEMVKDDEDDYCQTEWHEQPKLIDISSPDGVPRWLDQVTGKKYRYDPIEDDLVEC